MTGVQTCALPIYFVLPYTIQNYLADQAIWPKVSTDRPEFAEAEKGVQAEIDRLMGIQGKRSVDSIHKELGHSANENFFYVGCWEYQGSDEKAPELTKEPLEYEAIKVQTRNYKN